MREGIVFVLETVCMRGRARTRSAGATESADFGTFLKSIADSLGCCILPPPVMREG